MADYRIDVDVNVHDEKLTALKSMLENKPIKMKVDTSDAHKKITDLENRIKKLGNTKYNFGGSSGGTKKAGNEIDSFARKIDAITTKFKNLDFNDKYSNLKNSFKNIDSRGLDSASKSADKLRSSIFQVKRDYDSLKRAIKSGDADKIAAANENFNNSLKKSQNLLRIATRDVQNYEKAQKSSAAAIKLNYEQQKLGLKIDKWVKDNSKIKGDSDLFNQIKNIKSQVASADKATLTDLANQFDLVTMKASIANKTGLNFKDNLKAQFSRLSGYFGASSVIMGGIQATKQMYENVRDVDKAMTELKRVTDLSTRQYSDLYSNLTISAREYGTTLSDIINATADWSRAGFDPSIAKGLAEVTTMYQHIADVDYDTAFQNLETAYKGFETQLKQEFGNDTVAAVGYIGDILNELDNHFAVTADGVGQAIKRSASALSIAGNSIQETAGMVTGITEVTQDPEKAGNALKVLSMRLRGMKGELEDLGEDTDETVENLSKMQGQVLNLTHGHVNIFDDTGEFKSTYEIMQGIAEIYDKLSSTEQADLLETIAGKHRANDVAALINNWDQVASATEHATNAAGSAEREHAKYLDSIEGRMNALTSVWQTFSNTVMNSDFVKTIIKGLSDLLDILENVVSTIGGFGTAGLIGSLFLGFKKKSGISRIATDFVQQFGFALDATGKKLDAFKLSFKGLGTNLLSFLKTPAGIATGIGAVVTIIGGAISAYKAYQESIRKANQETIDNSNKFLDSYGNFEQAYIKYADKTVLTADEENELKGAIDGTISALGDKSSALRDAAGASSEYVTNLKEIAKAELTEAQRSATEAKKAAEQNLKSEAGEFSFLSGRSKASFELPDSASKEYEAIKDIMNDPDFKKYMSYTYRGYDQGNVSESWFNFDKKADIDGLIEQYNYALEIKNKLEDEAAETGNDKLLDSSTYKSVSNAIDLMSSNMDEFVQQTYNAEKAGYQLKNGIASTDEEFYKMRESILSSVSDSVEVRDAIGKLMNEEYTDTFDTSSIEAKMKYIKSVTKDIADIGGKNENTFETFLNLKAKVNNGECSVGDYVSQMQKATDAINDIEDEKTKEFLRVQLGIELDSDGNIKDDIKEARDKLIRDLKASGVAEDVATSFTDSLNNEEIVIAQDLLVDGELDLKNLDSKKVRAQIEKLAEHNKALKFSVDVDLETENLEKLNTAISESLSGTGLTTDSLTNVKNMFKGLDGYDPSKLFERTANGMRLNTDELRKMNSEYAKVNTDGLNNKLSALADEYLKTKEELADLTYGTDEYNTKANELSALEKTIGETEELAAQYRGLTSAYNQWQQAEAAGNQRDMYESIISGFKNVEDELSRGWVDDGTVEFIELLSGRDLSSGNIDKTREAWESLGETIEGTTYTVKDFFTTNSDGESTSDGVYNFLEAIDQKFQDSDIIQRDENGNVIGFDFKVAGGDEAIAEALGISEELVQIMVRAADDAGFVVSMDGTYQNLDVLKDKAQEAANSLKEMFKGTDKEITTEFNLQTSDENSIMEQYKSALDIWNEFKQNKNADGTINMNVEGAEEAFTLVSTLQSMVDKLSEPTYMNINASEVDKNLQKPLSELQEYERLTQQEHQLQLKGTDTTEIEKSKSEILDYFQDIQKNQPEISAKLGIDNLSREELEQKLNDGSLEVDAALNLQVEMNDTLRDQVNVALYSAGIIDKEELEKRVNVDVYADNVDTSDVENKTEEAVENSGDGEQSTETTANVDVKAGDVDTSDVKDKTEEAINDESGKDSTVEKSVDLEVNVEEYKEIIDDLNNANKDIKINVEVNGLDDVEKLTKNIDIAAKVDGSVQDLTEYAEAAKQLSGIDDNTTKTVSAYLYGNLDKNKNLDSLQQFVDSAKNLDGVEDSNVSVGAYFDGNIGDKDKKSQLNNLDKFAEGAKKLKDVDGETNVRLNAYLDSDIWGKGKESQLNNLDKFADGVSKLKGLDGETTVRLNAYLDTDIWGNDKSSQLNNLDKFAESVKSLQGLDGETTVRLNAYLDSDIWGNGKKSQLENLDKFADGVNKLKGLEGDTTVRLNAYLDSNVWGDKSGQLNNLDKFADATEKLKGLDGDTTIHLNAYLDSNVWGDKTAQLNNLDKFADATEKLKSLKGETTVRLNAYFDSDIWGNDKASQLNNLDKFAEAVKALQGLDGVTDVRLNAYLDSNLWGDKVVQTNTLDGFANAVEKLKDLDGDTTVSLNTYLDSNIWGDKSTQLNNLDKFADEADKLKSLNGSISVSLSAYLDSNLWGNDKASQLNNLDKFADVVGQFKNLNGNTSVSLNAYLDSNLWGNDKLAQIDNLSEFAGAVTALQGVSSETSVRLSAYLDSNIWGDDKAAQIGNLHSFASAASELSGLGSDISVSVSANILNSISQDGINNLSSFADVAQRLQSVSSVGINVSVNADIGSISSVTGALQSLASSGLMHDYNASVTVTTNVDSSGVDSYQPAEKHGTVKYSVNSSEVDNWSAPPKDGQLTYHVSVDALSDSQLNKTGTITYKANVEGGPVVNGTAHVNGTTGGRAFRNGDWGTKDSGTALMGELGQELIVRDGRFFTVGDDGAEFAAYKKGDIIFNHKILWCYIAICN